MRRLFPLLLAILATPLAAQDRSTIVPDCKAIEATLEAMVAKGRTVGASTLVWQNGHESCFETAGLADREDQRPFARNTLVQVFSMTKPVTGVALLQLWEQGKFGLDDPLAWYLPEFAETKVLVDVSDPQNEAVRAPRRAITVRDIMRHTAGFTYGGGDDPRNAADRQWQRLQPLDSTKTLAEFSHAMAQVPLLFDPGTHWSYSAGVDVQARLVEVLSGQPFAQYVQQHIFDPLGMKDSGWKRSQVDLLRLARIYVADASGALSPMPSDKWLEPNFMGRPLTMGGSGIVTTVDDYMRFARMLLGQGTLDGVQVLKAETVHLMATNQLDPRIGQENRSWLVGKGNGGFGLDVFVRTGPPLNPRENRGSVGEFFWDGYPSMLFWVDPLHDMAVVFATQRIDFDSTLHHDIREAVYGSSYRGR